MTYSAPPFPQCRPKSSTAPTVMKAFLILRINWCKQKSSISKWIVSPQKSGFMIRNPTNDPKFESGLFYHPKKPTAGAQNWRRMEDAFPFQRGDSQVPAVSFQECSPITKHVLTSWYIQMYPPHSNCQHQGWALFPHQGGALIPMIPWCLESMPRLENKSWTIRGRNLGRTLVEGWYFLITNHIVFFLHAKFSVAAKIFASLAMEGRTRSS